MQEVEAPVYMDAGVTEPIATAEFTAENLSAQGNSSVCDGIPRRAALNFGETLTLNAEYSCVLLLRIIEGKVFTPEGYPIFGPFEPEDWDFLGNRIIEARSDRDGAILEYLFCLTANMDRGSDSSGCQTVGVANSPE